MSYERNLRERAIHNRNGHSLDEYDDEDPVYAIMKYTHSDGRIEYHERAVTPPGQEREPDREHPFGHGHWDGFRDGLEEGGPLGYPHGFHDGAREGVREHGREAYDEGFCEGWGEGDWRGMRDAWDDYAGEYDPRYEHPARAYEYGYREEEDDYECEYEG